MTEQVSYGSKVYDDKGVLAGYKPGKTEFQKEAIAHNMTPLEWKMFNTKK